MVSKGISNISSDKATFNNAAPFYNDVLSASGYKRSPTFKQSKMNGNMVNQE